jgi:signal transduction histidine kinase
VAALASALLIAFTPFLAIMHPVLVLPWFVPTVTALVCLVFGALAFLGYLRYATNRLLYPGVFALTCWVETLFSLGFLLAWPGLVGSRGVIGDTPSAAAYFFTFGILALPLGFGSAHLAPPLTMVTASRRFVRTTAVAATVLCTLLIAVVAACDEYLPPLVQPGGSYTLAILVADAVGAAASIVVAALAWRRYRGGTIFLTGIAALLLIGQVGTSTVLLGISRYSLPFYGFHLVRAAVSAMALFALLSEYVQLYRAQVRLLALERARRDRLYEVARALAGTRDVERITVQIVQATQDLLGASAAALYRHDPASGQYHLQTAGGLAAEGSNGPAWPTLATDPSVAASENGVLMLPDAALLPSARLPRLGSGRAQAALAAGLPGQPQPLGVLEAYFATPRRFDSDEREMLRALADTAAPALENAQLFAELQVSQQRAQEAAALADARRVELEAVLQALPEGIIFVNRHTGEMRANPAAIRLLGLAPNAPVDQLVAERATRMLRPSGEPYPPDELPLTRALERGEAVIGEELVHLGREGEPSHLLASAAPLRGDAGETVGAVVLFQDISSLKELEHERDRFLSLVVHELRNPLAAIKGLAQVIERRLRQGMEVEPDRLQLITKQVDELHRLTTDLSDVSRLQAGRFELTPAPFDLAALVREVVDQQRAASPQHVISLSMDDEPLWVEADRQRISQVLINLLGNAVKYSPEANLVEVTVEANSRVRLCVRDHGIGVPVEARPLLFQRFLRATNARRQPGLGLGLYISQTLAQASGGAIGYEPAEPGSVFWIELPLRPAPAPAVLDTHISDTVA